MENMPPLEADDDEIAENLKLLNLCQPEKWRIQSEIVWLPGPSCNNERHISSNQENDG